MHRKITCFFSRVFRKINTILSKNTPKGVVISRAVMATLLGVTLSVFLVQPLSMTTSLLFSSPEKRDFQLPDLYAQIADNRPVREFDDRIVIVNIGRGNREDIAEAISILSLCGPKAVGVDINFAEPSDDDSFLLESLETLPNVVLPLGVKPAKENGIYEIEDKPFFFEELPNVKYGIVNLPQSSEKGTVREYAVEFPTSKGVLPSFVTAVVENVDKDALEKLKSRNTETGITSYHSREYQTIDFEDVETHAEDFADKIVLVGALEDAADMHSTPVKSHVAGLLLHAHALSTVLDGIWFEKVPKTFDYILAVTLCLGIMLIVYGMKNNFKGVILRVVQFSLAVLAVRIGYTLYIDHNVIFDITLTVTIVAFGLFAVDIWNSIEALWKIISEKLSKLEAKYST